MSIDLPQLAKQFSLPLDRLAQYVSEHENIIGLEDAEGGISLKDEDGKWVHLPPLDLSLSKKSPDKHVPLFLRDPDLAYLHFPIYGGRYVVVNTGKNRIKYSIEEFLRVFPSIILFVVPLYGAFEYTARASEMQSALRRFAVEFGSHVGEEVMVFDYWTEETFDYDQYEAQYRQLMETFGISEAELPALLIANRSPFTWNHFDPERKMVVLSFRDCTDSELGARLRAIARDIRHLELPSRWAHNWSRFRMWCRSHGILGSVFGMIGGIDPTE